MIRTVLVPLDGSKAAEAVIPYVELIASRTGAAVHLLTVVHDQDAEAKAGDADLIAMSTHGRSGLMRWVLGSVATKVLHGASHPLLLVRARDQAGRPPAVIDRILVPLDGSQLSLTVLPYVEELAEALGARLVLFHALLPLGIYPPTPMTP